MKSIPQIQRYMTTQPISIEAEDTLLNAKKTMQTNHIRHLPVFDSGKLVGVISEKDIDAIQGFKGVELDEEKVKFVMTDHPYIVSSDTLLDEVCKNMAAEKIGSVLVQDNHKLIGIFTWIDALNAMSSLLETRLK